MRNVHLAVAALLAFTALPSPTIAADVRGWFVDMKKTAKELRIAAAAGNEAVIGGMRAWAQESASKAGMWPMGDVQQSVVSPCRDASNTLLEAARAAESRRAQPYADAMTRYRWQEDSCFVAFTSAERRR